MMDAIFAGLLSGIISPLLLSWLQHRYIWKSQKRLEMKYTIFQEAVRALSLWATDALDPALQANKATHNGVTRVTECRPETMELLERSRGMVKAFYSTDAYAAYDLVLRAKLAIDNVPNEEFEQRRTVAILALAQEIGIKS